MKYKILGSSGLKVSELCLGAMTFGEEFGIGAPEAESRRVYESFVEAGGNFIDTANIYNQGTSERMLADFIKDDRDFLVLASKYSLSTRGDDPNAGGNQRKNLVQSLEASLRRLKTDYVDLYLVHAWDRTTALDELMRALDDQVRAGKILHIGISNAPAWVIASANTLAAERNMTRFTAMQLHYNFVERSIEREYFALANAQNMAIMAWSPLAGGLLTGKFNTGADAAAREGARLTTSPRGAQLLQPEKIALVEALAEMATEMDCTSAQLALAWMAQRSSSCVIPIVGARTARQLAENLGYIDIQLQSGQVAQLDELTALTPEYPQALFASDFFQTMMFGELRDSMEMPPGINRFGI
jgi:aryl-alcohol dehydrogenase-like predicted oxidoreductase